MTNDISEDHLDETPHPQRHPALSRRTGSAGERESAPLHDLGPGKLQLRPKGKRQASLRELRDKILADLDRARRDLKENVSEPKSAVSVFPESTVQAMLSLPDEQFRHALTDASLQVSRAHRSVGQAEWVRTRSIAEFAELFRIAELRAQPIHSGTDPTDGLPRPRGASTEDSDFFHRAVAAEVATAVHESQTQARELVTGAVHLETQLPCASEAHRQGFLGVRHLRVIVESTIGVEAGHARILDETLTAHSATLTPSRLRALANSIREQRDPIDAETKAEFARFSRSVHMENEPWGMARLVVYGPAADLHCAMDRMTRIAVILRKGEQAEAANQRRELRQQYPRKSEESRSAYQRRLHGYFADLPPIRRVAQLRCDAMISLLISGETDSFETIGGAKTHHQPLNPLLPEEPPSTPPTRAPAGVRGEVFLTMPLEVVVGLPQPREANEHTTNKTSVFVSPETILAENFARLHGYGPIDAASARELAGRIGVFSRLILDPDTGAALHQGRSEYIPSDELRKTLQFRDATCRFPGCDRAATRCDLDHSVPWGIGGKTDPGNLAHLCRLHHELKGHSRIPGKPGGDGWVLSDNSGGKVSWISPSGRRFTTGPVRPQLSRNEQVTPAPF